MSCRRRIVYQSMYQHNPDNCILYASQVIAPKLRKDKLPNLQTKTEVYSLPSNLDLVASTSATPNYLSRYRLHLHYHMLPGSDLSNPMCCCTRFRNNTDSNTSH